LSSNPDWFKTVVGVIVPETVLCLPAVVAACVQLLFVVVAVVVVVVVVVVPDEPEGRPEPEGFLADVACRASALNFLFGGMVVLL
jgi:hypothetical protein